MRRGEIRRWVTGAAVVGALLAGSDVGLAKDRDLTPMPKVAAGSVAIEGSTGR